MGEVDVAFVQDVPHRPNPSFRQEAKGIPLIDLSCPDFDALVDDIGNACRKWGFFQVINHGVPLERRQKIEDMTRQFFQLSLDEKRKVRRSFDNVMGYYDTEHTKNVRDWKEVFDFTVKETVIAAASVDPDDNGVTHWKSQWPKSLPGMREACQEYANDIEALGMRIMELIAMSLGLPPKRLEGFFKDQTSNVRLNRYPPCPSPHLALGVGHHKDPGGLTILAQDDVGGLEVKRKSDGQWVSVKPIPNAFIINIGDVIQVWTNGAYESVEHRVTVNTVKERFSIPVFLNPSHYTVVEVLEEMKDEENPPKYRPYNWGKFQLSRKRSNFMKMEVENLQISHFKI